MEQEEIENIRCKKRIRDREESLQRKKNQMQAPKKVKIQENPWNTTDFSNEDEEPNIETKIRNGRDPESAARPMAWVFYALIPCENSKLEKNRVEEEKGKKRKNDCDLPRTENHMISLA